MVKGGTIGAFGGGWLEHTRQWLGAQWAGLSLGVPTPTRAARHALRRRRSRAGAVPRGHFDHACSPLTSSQSSPLRGSRKYSAWRSVSDRRRPRGGSGAGANRAAGAAVGSAAGEAAGEAAEESEVDVWPASRFAGRTPLMLCAQLGMSAAVRQESKFKPQPISPSPSLPPLLSPLLLDSSSPSRYSQPSPRLLFSPLCPPLPRCAPCSAPQLQNHPPPDCSTRLSRRRTTPLGDAPRRSNLRWRLGRR